MAHNAGSSIRIIDRLLAVATSADRSHRVDPRCAGVDRGGWRIGEETAEVVALDDLGHRSCFDIANLDEGRLEGEDVGVMKS